MLIVNHLVLGRIGFFTLVSIFSCIKYLYRHFFYNDHLDSVFASCLNCFISSVYLHYVQNESPKVFVLIFEFHDFFFSYKALYLMQTVSLSQIVQSLQVPKNCYNKLSGNTKLFVSAPPIIRFSILLNLFCLTDMCIESIKNADITFYLSRISKVISYILAVRYYLYTSRMFL